MAPSQVHVVQKNVASSAKRWRPRVQLLPRRYPAGGGYSASPVQGSTGVSRPASNRFGTHKRIRVRKARGGADAGIRSMAKNDLQHKQDELSAIFVKQQEITNRQSEHVAAGSRLGAGAGSGDLGAFFLRKPADSL